MVRSSLYGIGLKKPELVLSLCKYYILKHQKDIQPKWQTAASYLIVSVGKKFKHEVMSELLENLVPGTLPHYFVILTLANFDQADGKSSPGKSIFSDLKHFRTAARRRRPKQTR